MTDTPTKKRGCLGRLFRGVAVLILLAVIAGVAVSLLGGDDDAEPLACRPAPDALVADIRSGLDDGVTIDDAYMVRAEDRGPVWYVAAQLRGGALDDATNVAVWGTSRITEAGDHDSTGLLYSVGGFANEFSEWGDGSRTDWNLSITDDAARQAEDCAATD